jgi:hypothetical protein
MKLTVNIIGGLLGFFFAATSAMFLLNMVGDMPVPPPGSPAEHFMAAFVPTGYLTLVKVCELIGGILLAIPRTRNWGLLVLGPIIVNILAYNFLVAKAADPATIVICALVSGFAAFLLWAGRRAFLNLLN